MTKKKPIKRIRKPKEQSEFGKGLTYCIALFLCHENLHDGMPVQLWFNGAGDHLFELNTDSITNIKLKREVISWRNKILKWRLSYDSTQKDKQWALSKGKEFLRRIDQTMLCTKTEKGQWE